MSAVAALIRKDLRMELRTRESVPSMFLFSLSTFVLFHFALGPSIIHPYLIERVDFYPGGYPARLGGYVSGVVTSETVSPPSDLAHASVDVRVYVADLETPPPTIRALHDASRIVMCYFSAGTAESFRDDAGRFPVASLGQPLADYPDERWIDPRDPTVRAIMADRIAKAASAGCDGIHPSGLGAFGADPGIAFTRADQLDYDRWLADAAHARGLSIGLVENDALLAEDLLADFDWTVAWSCIDGGCPSAAPFVSAHKAAFLVEYGDESRAAAVCPSAKALGMSAVVKRTAALDAYRAGCP